MRISTIAVVAVILCQAGCGNSDAPRSSSGNAPSSVPAPPSKNPTPERQADLDEARTSYEQARAKWEQARDDYVKAKNELTGRVLAAEAETRRQAAFATEAQGKASSWMIAAIIGFVVALVAGTMIGSRAREDSMRQSGTSPELPRPGAPVENAP